MQYRICTFLLFLSCAALCASCSSPEEAPSENVSSADSTFQQSLLYKLDSLEQVVSALTEKKDSQEVELNTFADNVAFQQEVISKLDSVETKITDLTIPDTTPVETGSKNRFWAWVQSLFRRPANEEQSNQEAPDVTLSDVEVGDDVFQREILERLDSLQLQVDSLSTPNNTLRIEAEGSVLLSDSVAALAGSLPPDSTTQAQEPDSSELNPDLLRKYWGRIFQSILIFVLFMYLIRSITWILDKLAERSATRRLLFKRIAPISKILLWIFAIYIIIVYIFNVTGNALLSAGTAAGVALAFAGQDVLKNIFGGLIIIADEPFQVGDKISIGATYGEVISIGLRSTRIVTSDDNLVSVPNSQVVESQVANANAGELHCQVVVELFLPGWVDVTKAKSIAYSAAATSKYVYLDKPIVVIVQDDFKEMSLLRLSVKAYVFDCLNELSFKSEVTESAKMEFLRHDMLKPFAYNFRPYHRSNRDGSDDAEAINP